MPFPDAVLEKLKTLPASPGVYVFRDGDGQVLYVGKAASLRSRVRSYFQAGTSDTRLFIGMLEGRLTDIETLVVRTEKEAVLLENQLIKELKPLWNVKLRDDKEFLSLRLRTKEPWPRLEVVRRPEADGARYFGPYHSATAARQTLRLVNRHFQLRTCTDTEMRSRKRPCLQYQIKRCPAPCVLDVDRAAYGAQVEAVSLFLDGRHDELVEQVESQMATAAERTEYELAAMYRDQMRAIEAVRESQRVAHVRDVDQDVLGLHRQADQAELAVVRLRRGRVVRVDTYALRDVNSPDDEILAAFLRNSYEAGTYVPHEVVLPLAIEAEAGLGALLSELRGGRVDIVHPKRGARNELVQLATDNARHAFEEKARAREDVERRLGDVQARLELPTLPRRIECIDVSHTGGEETVATIVALLDGAPDRDGYRSFRVRTVSGGDDYGAMHEVLGRRLRRGRDAESGWQLPDLLVVDGGRGQLNVALAVLKDLGVEVPVVGLAKEKESRATGELFVDRVYVPGAKNAIALRDSSAALQMLALARDEAHRTSNALRESVGRRRRLASDLDRVPGIGPKTRTMLLRTFGSVDGVLEQSDEALRAAGLSARALEALRRVLGASSMGTAGAGAESNPGAEAGAGAGAIGGAIADSEEATGTDEAEAFAVDNAFS